MAIAPLADTASETGRPTRRTSGPCRRAPAARGGSHKSAPNPCSSKACANNGLPGPRPDKYLTEYSLKAWACREAAASCISAARRPDSEDFPGWRSTRRAAVRACRHVACLRHRHRVLVARRRDPNCAYDIRTGYELHHNTFQPGVRAVSSNTVVAKQRVASKRDSNCARQDTSTSDPQVRSGLADRPSGLWSTFL